MRLRQPTIEDLLEAPTREGDPSTSFEAAGRVKTKEKQRLTLEALLELRRHNAAPVEAWRVHRKAQRIHERRHPQARPLGESTIRTRLSELCRLGLVEVADQGGRSEAGGRCSRYRLTRAGMAEAKEVRNGSQDD